MKEKEDRFSQPDAGRQVSARPSAAEVEPEGRARDRWLQRELRLIQSAAEGSRCGKTGMMARLSCRRRREPGPASRKCDTRPKTDLTQQPHVENQRPYWLTVAHVREVIEVMTSGCSVKRFHAAQQASTIAP